MITNIISTIFLFLDLSSSSEFAEFIWRCMLRNQLEKVFSIILAIMSAAILLAEATLLPSGVNLSLFSMLINAVGNEEILVQVNICILLLFL